MKKDPWFITSAERFDSECSALDTLNVQYEIDDGFKENGFLKMNLIIEGGNPAFNFEDKQRQYHLTAVFPEQYPYFRPEVYDFDSDLPRHQNPFGKNLCLLERPPHNWSPEWTLAELLRMQYPKVLQKGSVVDPEAIMQDEHEQAEPISEYYVPPDFPTVLFDASHFDDLDPNAGIRMIGTFTGGAPDKTPFPTRLAITQINDAAGKNLSQLDQVYELIFPKKINGYLYQLASPPPIDDPKQAFEWLRNQLKEAGIAFKNNSNTSVTIGKDAQLTALIGLCFPEEITPGVQGMGWLFIEVVTIKHAAGGGKRAMPNENRYFFQKPSRINKNSLTVRVPKLRFLENHTISIAGLGALGAPSALEFARNGIKELRLIEFDIVEPATTVRWPLGLSAAGNTKLESLQNFIRSNYPDTKIDPIQLKIGSVPPVEPVSIGPTQVEQIDRFFEGTSLVFDATAEPGINHYLAMEAQTRGIPYVGIYATPGAWGGLIMRVLPGKTKGCWMCLQYWKDAPEGITLPPVDPAGLIQPAGCADVTFTGASFDLQNVSLAGVRLAISSLSDGDNEKYPTCTFNVGVLELMKNDDILIMPKWTEYPLNKHPECPYCNP